MTALYVLVNEYRAAAEQLANIELDEQTVADTLEGLSGELEVKAQQVAFMVRNMEVTADAIAQFIKDQSARAKAIQHRADGLRSYLHRCMEEAGIEKIEGPGISLSFRKSSAVAIDEPGLIPVQFMRTPEPPPPAPDKKAIADAIKAGVEVPGAHIEHRRSLQIK